MSFFSQAFESRLGLTSAVWFSQEPTFLPKMIYTEPNFQDVASFTQNCSTKMLATERGTGKGKYSIIILASLIQLLVMP